MSSRWKKVWADFWRNKMRSLLIILTILVGTTGVGFVNSFNRYMSEGMNADFLSASPSEALIEAYPMNDDIVKSARAVPGVNAAEGRSTTVRQVIQPDGRRIPIKFTAIEDPYSLTVNTLQPVKGESSIAPLGSREVLIDASAASLGYQPDDMIVIDMGGGKRSEIRLAGFVHAPAAFPYITSRIINAYVTPKTMEWLGGSRDYNTLEVSVAENPTDKTHVNQVAQLVAERLEHGGASVSSIRVYEPGHHPASTFTQLVVFIMGVIGWLIVILSCFLIINSITALMAQQTRQIGIMKATGGGTPQIFAMYMVLILFFGLIALIISVPLADRIADVIGNGMAEYLSIYMPPYPGYTSTLIQQGIVALLVPLLAALWPIYNAVRLTVRETLTDYGIGGSEKPRKKAVSRGNLIIPRPIRLSLRNVFRRKLRLSLTLCTLVMAGAIFLAIRNLAASFDSLLEDYKGYYVADVTINFDRPYRFEEVASMAEAVAGIEGVEGWLQYGGTLIRNRDETGTQVRFVAPPSTSSLITPKIIFGRWLQPGDENAVVIGDQLVKMFPDLKVGDSLTIDIDGREQEWDIVGIYAFIQDVGIYTNYEYLSRLIGRPGEIYSLRVITGEHDAASQEEASNRLQALYAARGVRVSSAQTGVEQLRNAGATFNIFVFFLTSMTILIAVVGTMGLMGTMSINVMERTREIGVLRAIGASGWNIQSIVIVEGILVCLISWIISILLSIPLTGVLTTGVGMQFFQAPMPAVLSMGGVVVWLVGMLIIGTVSSALPAFNASRLTIKDILAYEG